MAKDKSEQTRTQKRPKSYLPEVKRKRIVGRHVAGESYRKIAAGEGVNKETVGRVLNLPESKEELHRLGDDQTARLREELRGLVPAALRKLADSVEDDPNIAYKILRGAGVARYKDESKVEVSQSDPYAKYSGVEKAFYLQHGRFPKPQEMGQAEREYQKWEEEQRAGQQSEVTPVQ